MKRFEKALTYFVERQVNTISTIGDGSGWAMDFDNGRIECNDETMKRPHVKGFRLVSVDYDDLFATMHFVRPSKIKGRKFDQADVKVPIGTYLVEHAVTGGLVDPHADEHDNLPPDPSTERVVEGPRSIEYVEMHGKLVDDAA